jgi:hypothetical protein
MLAEPTPPQPATSAEPVATGAKPPPLSRQRDERSPEPEVASPPDEDGAGKEPEAPAKIVNPDLDEPPTVIDQRFAKWAQLDELVEDEGKASEPAPPASAAGAPPAKADDVVRDTDPAEALLDAADDDDEATPKPVAPAAPAPPADVPEVPSAAVAQDAADGEQTKPAGRSLRVAVFVGLVVLVAAGFGGVLFAMLGGKGEERDATDDARPSSSAAPVAAAPADAVKPTPSTPPPPASSAVAKPEPESGKEAAQAKPVPAEPAKSESSEAKSTPAPPKPPTASKPATPRRSTPRPKPRPAARKPASPGTGTFVPGEL